MPFSPIYAVIYAYYQEDENAVDPDIYQIILHDLVPPQQPRVSIDSGCLPIYVSIHDSQKKNLFDAAMKAAATRASSFAFTNENNILNRYEIIQTAMVDQAFSAKYKKPVELNWSHKKRPTITFYFRSNKCFREKHPCTPCRARIRPKPEYSDFTSSIVIDIIRCDKCEKYFVTKEVFAAKGGCWNYFINIDFDSSLSSSDRHDIRFGYHYSSMQETFDDFAQHSDINNDGYSTQKPATVRQSLLKSFIDTGRYSSGEIIQYLHEKYLDTGWHGKNATSRARDDLNFVLDYIKEAETIEGELNRP